MDAVEMQVVSPHGSSSDQFCAAVLSKFSTSTTNEHHLHVCTAIGTMSQELKDQNLPLTPIAYFGSTCSSLDRLCSGESPGGGHLVDALMTILSLVVDELNPAVLKLKYDYLSELLVRIFQSKSAGVNGIVPGLNCVSRLLIVREKVVWGDVAQLYSVLLCYLTDDRAKVRKKSHSCLRDVLANFQISPVLAPLLSPASEAITKVFERYLLLAGGSNEKTSEGPKGAQEVLYVLDALKFCLPYISAKSSTNVMKYFKSLLELGQPMVTRRIIDGLNALCLHSIGGVSADILLDLLCTLANSVSSNKSSADSMTVIARLLEVGMKRVYSLNRQICVVKLPVVFSALKDILVSEHEEALVAAVETFKSLVHTCIDESLIKQGVEQISVNAIARKSGPTVIEKVCATIESLLDYHYAAVWDKSFQIISSLFDKLGKYSSYLLKGTLKSLADMQQMPGDDSSLKKKLHECTGSALGALGPEEFLSLLPLKLDAEDPSESNLWLFPILKQYIIGANLSYFSKEIFNMIKEMKRKSTLLEREGKIYTARSIGGIIYSLWALLPSFCNYPVDTAESFEGLEKVLVEGLHEYPDVFGIICSSLQILILQNKKILEGKEDLLNMETSMSQQRAIARYTSKVAEDNLRVLRSSAPRWLNALSKFLKSSDTGGLLQKTIGELASISDRRDVKTFFMSTMKKLLKVTEEASKLAQPTNSDSMHVDNSPDKSSLLLARAQLLDLAVSLLPGLDAMEIDLLVVAIKPALKDVDGLIQKKAYKVLSNIFQCSGETISRRLEDMLSLMIEVLPSCHFSAKRHRLDCLYFLIVHVSKDASESRRRDITASFLTEIILALKEANRKTRNRAYDILIQIGHAYGDEDKGGKTENLYQFFDMVAGGLAGETPHTISAAMKGLARLAYEFSDLISAAYNILPSTFLLLQRKNREIIKANLGLLKVLIAKSQAEGLRAHLQSMVESLLNWQDSSKNHFKAKVKLLLEMLIKKCGLDAVKEVMPEEHMKLLTNIRKLKERKERKQAKSMENGSIQSEATTSRMSGWNHTKIFSDFGGDETEISGDDYVGAKTISGRQKTSMIQSKASSLRLKRIRRAAKSLQEDLFDQLDDEPLDLLDRQKARSSLRSSEVKRKNSDSDDEPEIDAEGRLIIHEGGKRKKRDRKEKRESEIEEDGRSEVGSHLSASSKKTQKRRKTSESGWAYTGKEYASKKAGGDLKRKDKLEPFAYWPLDRKMVSRRAEHRAAARKGMASVVKLTKKLEGRSVSNALSLKGVTFKDKKKGNQKKR